MTGVRTPSLAARLDITLSLTCHDQPSLLLPHLLSLLPWDLGSILYHRSLDRLSPARSPLISRRISTLQPRGPSLRSRALPVLLPWVILFRGSRRFTIPPLSLDRFPSPLCRPPAPPPPLPHLSSSCSVSASSAKPFFPHLHHSPSHLGGIYSASRGPWVPHTRHNGSPLLCHFKSLSGVDPVTPILSVFSSQPPNLGDRQGPHQDFSNITLREGGVYLYPQKKGGTQSTEVPLV